MDLKIVSVQLKTNLIVYNCIYRYLEVTLINIQENPFNGTKPSLS